MNLNFLKKLILVLITTLIFFSTINSVNYNPSNNIFDSEIIDVFDIGDYEYYVNLNIETLIDKNLDYDIEILYDSENLVVGSNSFSCSSYCERNIQISKVFFGNYKIIIRTKYNNKYYEKILNFKIDLEKPESKLIIDDIYYVKNGELKLNGSIESNSNTKFDYFFEIFPKSYPELKSEFELTCLNKCDFDFDIISPIVIDDYYINVYSIQGDLQEVIEVKYLEKELKFKDILEIYGFNNLSNFYLYDNDNSNIFADISIKKEDVFVDELNFSILSFNELYELNLDFSNSTLKGIKVPKANLSQVSIGYEKVPKEKINLLNTISDAFAINPKFNSEVESYSITFEATGTSLLKCTLYNFETQTCFGSFKKILDTIPGRIYTIDLEPYDPLFVQVNDYIIAPSNGLCQDIGSGWSLTNCDDTSYSGSTLCPAGTSGEYTFCDDTFIESHAMTRDLDGGVQMYFQDTSQSKCENISKVEVLYKVWWIGVDTKGTELISIDADGNGWTNVGFTQDFLEPTSNRILDVTNSLPIGEYWDCNDFFSTSSTAAIEVLWDGTRAKRNGVYDVYVDTLVYRVSYNYSTNPLDIDKDSYFQGESVLISGSQVWDDSSTVSLQLTLSNNTVINLPNQTPVNNSFNYLYTLGDYFPLGSYSLFAIQTNNSFKNDTLYFNVTRRNPSLNGVSYYVNLGDVINFIGLDWVKSGVIDFSYTDPEGVMHEKYDIINTDINGEFLYNWTFVDSLFIDTGLYIFNFNESLDPSYNAYAIQNIIFTPNQSSINTSIIDSSDGNTYNVGGLNGIDSIDFSFPEIIPPNYDSDNVTIFIEYSTIGTANRELQWLNDTSGLYQSICILPGFDSNSIYSCEISSYAIYLDDYNSLNLRLSEDGSKFTNWYVDFIYLHRNFTIKDNTTTDSLNLGMYKNITRSFDNNYNINLILRNLDSALTPKNKDLLVYTFIPNEYSLVSNFVYSSSLWYTTINTSEISSNQFYNGTLYKFNITAISPTSSVFDAYLGVHDEDNSWSLLFNVSGNGVYNFEDLFLTGFR
ncbi:MAG: hypothetical protein PF569_00815 [Candidatus Woesearchaeota archaeon]|jgi:hypothetical protein|nr:hypothetical protein [Candidatus Woesearchaeota archaeon]